MTGPYVVTARRGEGFASRRAVATLDEARRGVRSLVADLGNECMRATGETAGWPSDLAALRCTGTVGPLPDGTVIEVEAVSWHEVLEDVIDTLGHIPRGVARTLIAAHNAAHEAEA